MPVVRIIHDVQFETDGAAQAYARQRGGDIGVVSVEVAPTGMPKLPDPLVASAMLRVTADYAVTLADALDKINAQQSVKSDVTPLLPSEYVRPVSRPDVTQ